MIARTVLVVDDDPDVRTVVRKILLRQGFKVLEAKDGLAAFELLQRLSGGVQLLVTEIQLPRMDGITLGQKVSTDYPKIEVLYMSGFVEETIRHIPIRHFLPKPFRADALAFCVQGLCT